MFTKFQCFTAMSILFLSASGISWGATNENPPAKSASRDAAHSRVIERLQNSSGPIKLVLRGHTKVAGRVVKMSSDHLTIQTLEGDEIVERTIQFDQIKKVTYIVPGHPYLKLIAGNVVGSGILALIILAAVGAL
jgi:TRAP-type mannitol/chloroaromatic compound transport system substrate-binding protein